MRDIAKIKKAAQSGTDSLFSLSSSYVSLDIKLGLKSTGRCAVSFKSVDGSIFFEMEKELRTFLDSLRSEFDINYNIVTDSYGYLWVTFDGQKVEDLLAGVNAAADTVMERGFKEQLLAAVFEFKTEQERSYPGFQYIIYNYKRKCFYPFVPTGKDQRNTESEMKIMAAVGDEMPFEKDMGLWYPIWNLPLS